MTKFVTKCMLYNLVDNLKVRLDLAPTQFPLDALDLAYKYCVNLEVQFIEFDKLCGILHKTRTTTTMALNKLRSPQSQNFDCMHELIHYFLHTKQSLFNCIGFDDLKQNHFLEWQANEGAAQALVPYQEFIPLYVKLATQRPNDPYLFKTIDFLADSFNVSEQVIINRINTLRYEIYQYYIQHIPLEKLNIISYSKQKKYDLHFLKAEKKLCACCHSIVKSDDLFCSICGRKLNLFNSWEGLDYMKYDRIEINPETSKVSICPVCQNEEIEKGDYCPICKTYLVNKCTGFYFDEDDYLQNTPIPCHTLQDGNARYCVKCGSKTTFFEQKLLQDWQEAQKKLKRFGNDNTEKITFGDDDIPF